MCIIRNHAIPTSSYTYDKVPSFLNVLLTKLNEKEETHCDFPKSNNCEPLSEIVQQIFYRMWICNCFHIEEFHQI